MGGGGGLGSPAAQGKPTSMVWALNGSFSSGRGSAKSQTHCFSPAESVLRVSHPWDGCWRESGAGGGCCVLCGPTPMLSLGAEGLHSPILLPPLAIELKLHLF